MDTMRFNYYFEHKDVKVIIDQTDWDHILETLMGKGIEIRQVAAEQSVHWTAYAVIGLAIFVLGAVFGFWLAGI